MRKSLCWSVALACIAIGIAAAGGSSASDVPAGQAVFMSQACNTCHAVPAAGIEPKMVSSKLEVPPLPGADAPSDEWITRFLRKEVEKDGKLHMKKFTGTDDELAVMLAWLRGLSSSTP